MLESIRRFLKRVLEHIHVITDGKRKISDTLRYLNGISARRLIDHLKENGPEESLRKLQLEEKAGNYKYSLWEHHSDKFLLTSESMFMQKVNYIHNNPVDEGLAERPEDYKYSSARYWLSKPLLDDDRSRWTSNRSAGIQNRREAQPPKL